MLSILCWKKFDVEFRGCCRPDCEVVSVVSARKFKSGMQPLKTYQENTKHRVGSIVGSSRHLRILSSQDCVLRGVSWRTSLRGMPMWNRLRRKGSWLPTLPKRVSKTFNVPMRSEIFARLVYKDWRVQKHQCS